MTLPLKEWPLSHHTSASEMKALKCKTLGALISYTGDIYIVFVSTYNIHIIVPTAAIIASLSFGNPRPRHRATRRAQYHNHKNMHMLLLTAKRKAEKLRNYIAIYGGSIYRSCRWKYTLCILKRAQCCLSCPSRTSQRTWRAAVISNWSQNWRTKHFQRKPDNT